MKEWLAGIATRATFVGGSEDSKTRDVWATQEIIVPVPLPPTSSQEESTAHEELAKQPGRASSYPRQIYKLVGQSAVEREATYQLVRVEEAP